jgi:hypothetical protein
MIWFTSIKNPLKSDFPTEETNNQNRKHQVNTPKERLHSKLLFLKEAITQGNLKSTAGLCHQYEILFHVDLIEDLAENGISWSDWPSFSGNGVFPVPGGELAYHDAVGTSSQYLGSYGKLRLELLDWLIEQASQE